MSEAPASNWYRREGLALLTDLYQLTMMSGHWHEGRTEHKVSFDYFFRSLPPHAGFAVMAGLDPLLDYLENLRFGPDDIDYLRSVGLFDEGFLAFLGAYRPNFSVHSVAEGTLVFPYEPVVRVDGSIFETQLVETALLNFLNHQTLIASKAARICLAALGEPVMEFGLRRAHGPDGGLSGSRAAYIGGCTSTSNVLAGKVYGIPVAGTHAHSWVMSFPSELEAFRAFARHYPDNCTLLVDTYDTEKSGVPNAIAVFKEMHARGLQTRPAIRLDSGDLAKLSKIAYRMMIDAGLENPKIVGSNDLDEDLIADLKRQGAKINAWGVGTHLITGKDCPSLGGVYKLAAVWEGGAWQPRMKFTSNIEKATDPGRKNVVRYFDAEGYPLGDVMVLEGEEFPKQGTIRGRHRAMPGREARLPGAARAEVLLKPVFVEGRRVLPRQPVGQIRQHAQDQMAALPEEFKRLRNPEFYRVLLSSGIGKVKDALMSESGAA